MTDFSTANENHGYRWLRTFFWCAAIALGAVDAWATRNTMNPDGVSYLDIGDAYWRGDWHSAINAYWSPLYSWLLGFALKVLKPSAYWEYPVVHLVNFVIYLAALASFEFLMRAFMYDRTRSRNGASADGDVTLPDWAWWTLGYSLFISTSLVMIGMTMVTPDMCVAAFVYLASGLLLRVRSGIATRGTFALLGAVFGFGYLAKAVLLPLAFVFLAVALFSPGSVRKAVTRVMISALVFLAIAGPFIAAISRAKGRLTSGDAGRLAYAGCVNGVDFVFAGDAGRITCGEGRVQRADADLPDHIVLQHPVRKIFDAPATYQFAGPIGGTYPFWYDPSYWQEGVKPHFDLKGQVRQLTEAFVAYCRLCFSLFMQLNVSTGLLTLFLLAPRPSLCLKAAAATWHLLIPALSALALYSLVLVEDRYVAAFVSLLWLAAFSGVRLPRSRGSVRLIAVVVVAITATTGVLTALSALQVIDDRSVAPVYWKAARALTEKGIHPGDKIAIIDDRPLGEGGAFVARLARIQIIAEVNQPDRFWAADGSTQSRVLEAIAKTGAKAAIGSQDRPFAASGACWQRLGSHYYVYIFTDSAC